MVRTTNNIKMSIMTSSLKSNKDMQIMNHKPKLSRSNLDIDPL